MIEIDESGQQGVNIAGVMFPVEHVTGCIFLGSKGHSGYAVVGAVLPCRSVRYIDGEECATMDPEYHIMAEFMADFSKGFVVNAENLFRNWNVSTVLGIEKNEDMSRRFRQITGRKVRWYRQNIGGKIKKPTDRLEYDDEMFFADMFSRRKKYSSGVVYIVWSTCPHAKTLVFKSQRDCIYRMMTHFDQRTIGKSSPLRLEVEKEENKPMFHERGRRNEGRGTIRAY